METIQLKLEIAEVNKILTALGAAPYAEVYLLIQKIQQQAAAQIDIVQRPPLTKSAGADDEAE